MVLYCSKNQCPTRSRIYNLADIILQVRSFDYWIVISVKTADVTCSRKLNLELQNDALDDAVVWNKSNHCFNGNIS